MVLEVTEDVCSSTKEESIVSEVAVVSMIKPGMVWRIVIRRYSLLSMMHYTVMDGYLYIKIIQIIKTQCLINIQGLGSRI